MSIRVGLFGFGRTGSVVAQEIARDTELSLEWVCRRQIPNNLKFASHSIGYDNEFAPFVSLDQFGEDFLKKNPVDLIIDFSSGSGSQFYNLIAQAGIRIVSAISNYEPEQLELVNEASKKTALLYSPNITLGINWLIMASQMLKKIIPHADVEIVEEHFRDKKDISGTAKKLAQHLDLDVAERVNSIRVGGIVGKHEVIFGLPYQTIRLTHESISRAAFGTGAIFGGKWLTTKKAGLYSMENLVSEKFFHQTNLNQSLSTT